MTTPLVSICCLSYNHEDYIGTCLDSLLKQQTSFPFEIIIHDDASTDHSPQIIRDYASRFPNIIKPILQTENQYSKGKGILAPFLFPVCRGIYIAFCECDDYWTDNHKLQRQIDFLTQQTNYSAIGENGLIINTITNQQRPFNQASSHDVTMEEVIITRRFPTAGVVCRKAALEGYQQTCRIQVDTILWCWLLSKGKFRYSDTISSVYRRGWQGVTENTPAFKFAKQIETWNMEILRVFHPNKHFIYVHMAKIYKSYFTQAIHKHQYYAALLCLMAGIAFLIRSIFA